MGAREATSVDAHDLFRFYAMTTPHAVQRAEQLSIQDFDLGRRAAPTTRRTSSAATRLR